MARMPSVAARGRSRRAPREAQPRNLPRLVADSITICLAWSQSRVSVVSDDAAVVGAGVSDLDLWRLNSRYGSRKIPAVASAMPLIVDSDADEMAVSGSHRRMSITMGFVSRLQLLLALYSFLLWCMCSPFYMFSLQPSLTHQSTCGRFRQLHFLLSPALVSKLRVDCEDRIECPVEGDVCGTSRLQHGHRILDSFSWPDPGLQSQKTGLNRT